MKEKTTGSRHSARAVCLVAHARAATVPPPISPDGLRHSLFGWQRLISSPARRRASFSWASNVGEWLDGGRDGPGFVLSVAVACRGPPCLTAVRPLKQSVIIDTYLSYSPAIVGSWRQGGREEGQAAQIKRRWYKPICTRAKGRMETHQCGHSILNPPNLQHHLQQVGSVIGEAPPPPPVHHQPSTASRGKGVLLPRPQLNSLSPFHPLSDFRSF
jgi:hypothetical protein